MRNDESNAPATGLPARPPEVRIMAICRYCRQKAGWFTAAHAACEQRAKAAMELVKTSMASAVIAGKQYSEISGEIDDFVKGSNIPDEWARAALMSGWSQGAEQRSKTQPLSPAEIEVMDKILKDAGFQPEDSYWTAGGMTVVWSLLIWTVLHNKMQHYQGPITFNLHAGELPVWGMPNLLLKEQMTTVSYVGGYNGASTRVASGLYYHFGGLRGHRVESTSFEEVDFGNFLLTDRAIYFGGTERGVNFRLPYGQIIRFRPYSDAVGICRSGVREQVFVPTGAHTPAGMAIASGVDRSRVRIQIPDRSVAPIVFPDCGWFLFNILQALAAKDSVSNAPSTSRTAARRF
jgi:hypothetical protein